jgi:lysophospholipase
VLQKKAAAYCLDLPNLLCLAHHSLRVLDPTPGYTIGTLDLRHSLTMLWPNARSCSLEMHSIRTFVTFTILFTYVVIGLPLSFHLTSYAPTPAQCPSAALIRLAGGLSIEETQFIGSRYSKASDALRTWLLALNSGRAPNDTFRAISSQMPLIGFASSGGGVRAVLTGAGVIQAMDNRDNVADKGAVGGLWQAISYHSGTSSGSWLLAALAGNDGATISTLLTNIWISGFDDPSFLPFEKQGPDTFASLSLDCIGKAWSGYPPTLVDALGRVISQHLFLGDNSGIGTTMSSLVNSSNFQTSEMPYPIIATLSIDPVGKMQQCIYGDAYSPQYEFHPFEYGSWDPAARFFAKTQFMGSAMSDGATLSHTTCLTGFDNLGFLVASSSNMLNLFCGEVPKPNRLFGELGTMEGNLIRMASMVHSLSFLDEYAIVPNPFYSPGRGMYASDELYLVDGTQGGENLPLWPLIQPERQCGVIIANDNSADTASHWPNGTSLFKTYLRAQSHGLTTMPKIPSPSVIAEQNYAGQPLVFGCDDSSKITIIWIPNKQYTFASNKPDWVLKYSSSDVTGMVMNGNMIATMGGDAAWPMCLACVILKRSNEAQTLPFTCSGCFDKFCWRG